MSFYQCLLDIVEADPSLRAQYKACEKNPESDEDSVDCLKKVPAFANC
jgi:hypothetical protein